MNKLTSVNTDSWITNWLCSYLSGKEQYTVFGGNCSTSSLSHEGVPQGAVLSHPRFSFFLHDLPSSTEMNEFLSRIDCWSVGNGLILNPSKCQAVNFSMRYERYLNTILRSHIACAIGDSDKHSVEGQLAWCYPLL
ncbi:unnamed protein product [Schistosoma margrebowiei]|uniref:Uncharacterized protein n=1 Tax=Schistosoma margrebowiei TaxID=48269 RepID=A0A183LTZ0_9TREM|nr:unnamed protein product [Schistosoma margrebowiei]